MNRDPASIRAELFQQLGFVLRFHGLHADFTYKQKNVPIPNTSLTSDIRDFVVEGKAIARLDESYYLKQDSTTDRFKRTLNTGSVLYV